MGEKTIFQNVGGGLLKIGKEIYRPRESCNSCLSQEEEEKNTPYLIDKKNTPINCGIHSSAVMHNFEELINTQALAEIADNVH